MDTNRWNSNWSGGIGTGNYMDSIPKDTMNNMTNARIVGYNQFGQPIYEQPQKQNPTYLKGRVVATEQDIAAGEVPNMNNEKAYFVQTDGQVIFEKWWAGDGQIHTNYYIKYDPNQQNQLNAIAERLDRIEKQLTRPPRKPKLHQNSNQKGERRDESATN